MGDALGGPSLASTTRRAGRRARLYRPSALVCLAVDGGCDNVVGGRSGRLPLRSHAATPAPVGLGRTARPHTWWLAGTLSVRPRRSPVGQRRAVTGDAACQSRTTAAR